MTAILISIGSLQLFKGRFMNQYIVFRAGGQYIVSAETSVRAVQAVILEIGGFAKDWNVHNLSDYNPKLRARVIADSVIL